MEFALVMYLAIGTRKWYIRFTDFRLEKLMANTYDVRFIPRCNVYLHNSQISLASKEYERVLNLKNFKSMEMEEFEGIYGDTQHLVPNDIELISYWNDAASKRYEEQINLENLDA